MGKRNSSKAIRAKENEKRKAERKARAKISERKRLGLKQGEEESLLAGFIRRYLALMFDLFLTMFMWIFLLGVQIVLFPEYSITSDLLPVAVLVFGVVYTIPKLALEGQTYGRRKMKIEVIRRDGEGLLTWTQSIVRWIVEWGVPFVFFPILTKVFDQYLFTISLIGIIVFVINFIPFFFSEYKQTLHDIIADSAVVRLFPEKKKFFSK